MPAYPDDTGLLARKLARVPEGSPVAVVAGRLLDLVTTGDLAVGTRLPPERQLAATLEVGRSAVREALAALEVLGIVDVRPGSGTYLRGSVSELLPQTLSWGMLIGRRSSTELIEVRGALEIYSARLAAERMPDDAVSRLGEHLERMRARADDPPAFVDADLAFHHDLAASVDNAVLLDLLQIIRSLLRVWADRAVEDPDEIERAIAEHAAVFEAIADRDGDRAASAMATHMLSAGRRLTATLEAAES
jgi:GntR family transcriptional repressor for pyruvate dehydrogenase complex